MEENYTFTDSKEVHFGRPKRKFNSFYEAADQAVIIIMHGGIHFIAVMEKGREQGKKIGESIMLKLEW